MGFKRLFFDIETSYMQGWFWQPSFKTSISYDQVLKDSAIICICYKWQGSDKMYHLKWDNGCDKEMMRKFYEVIMDADEIVGHNGDKFDLKWIRTRFLKHGFVGLPQLKSIDTLKISRKYFRFKSNRLDNIGKELGFGGKYETGGIQLWHDIIQKNSRKAMSKMIEYCKRDVVLLEKVYLKLEGYSTPKTHVGMFGSDGEKIDCPFCGGKDVKIKDRVVSASGGIKIRMTCKECIKYYLVPLKVYNDWNIKRMK